MEYVVLGLLNGISFGMILFVLATGLSITLGLMGILNLAHGALFMLGAYMGWAVTLKFGLGYWPALLLGGIVAGLVGLGIERGFLRFLYRQLNEQALLTVGFLYIITNVCQLIWGGQDKVSYVAPALSASFPIVGWEYPVYRMALIGFGIVMAIGMWWFQDKTRIGTIVRAGMDDREMTGALGINLGRISYLVFFAGAFLAGIGGVLGAQLIGPNLHMGFDILVLALIVVVVGGMGSVQGALLGAILIGIIDSFGRGLFPEFASFIMFLVMVIVILVKPSGLLGRER